MNEEEYGQELIKALTDEIAKQYANAVDERFLEGLKMLSPRKKKKIHKWVLKELKKHPVKIEKYETNGVPTYTRKEK